MKKRLFLKFTAAYAILALLMFLVTTTLGRQLFYDRLVSDCAEKLYAEASVIAGSRASRYPAIFSGRRPLRISMRTCSRSPRRTAR